MTGTNIFGGDPGRYVGGEDPTRDDHLVTLGYFNAHSGGAPVDVTDGTHTVTGVTELDFTSGATVTDAGGGVAQVAVNGGSLPSQWEVDPDTGQFILNFTGGGDDAALVLDHSSDPTDHIFLFRIGGDDTSPTGRQVYGFDSAGDADHYFREEGVSLIYHRLHDGENTPLVKIGDSQFYVGNQMLLANYDDKFLQIGQTDSTLTFFGGSGVTKRTGVAVDAAGIHAALVAYGLIAA